MRTLLCGVWLLLIALALAISTGALTGVSASRAGTATVTPDSASVVELEGFRGDAFALPGNQKFRQTGILVNRSDRAAAVRLAVDPRVDVACLGGKCNKEADWRLEFCWAEDAALDGEKTCTGGAQLTFAGSGPADPAEQAASAGGVPPGGVRYLYVRLDSSAHHFCASATFTWRLDYDGGGAATVGHVPNSPRLQVYEAGDGC